MTQAEANDPFGRAVELFVLAPIGAGAFVRDNAPAVVNELVARGRAEVARRRSDLNRRVTTVRSTGQVAVVFGVPMLRKRVEELLERSGSAPGSEPAPTRDPVPPVPTPITWYARDPDAPTPVADAPTSDGLPIPGYDALSASQVVERLAGLERDELDAVQAYESAHRQRRTILGKIEQLAG